VILTRPSWERAFKKLTEDQQHRVDTVLASLEQIFGRPHRHAGIGVRPIGHYLECRAGLDLRILFVASKGDLILVTVGNHNAVRAFIKNSKSEVVERNHRAGPDPSARHF